MSEVCSFLLLINMYEPKKIEKENPMGMQDVTKNYD